MDELETILQNISLSYHDQETIIHGIDVSQGDDILAMNG
jgi:hypothetical protein